MASKRKKATEKKKLDKYSLLKWEVGATEAKGAELDKILEAQEEHLKKDSKNYRIWFARGMLYKQNERYEEAIECFDVVNDLKPDFKGAWSAKANILSNLGMHKEASNCFKKVLQLTSKSFGSGQKKKGTEEKNVEKLLMEVIDEDLDQKYALRLKELNGKIDKDPTDMLAFLESAQILSKMGKYRDALNALHEATKQDMYYPEVWKMKGDLFLKLGDSKKAVISFQRACDLLAKKVNCPTCKEDVDENLDFCPKCGSDITDKRRAKIDSSQDAKPSMKIPKPTERKIEPHTKPERLGNVGFTNGMERDEGKLGRTGRINGIINGKGKTNGFVKGRGKINGLKIGKVNGLDRGGMTSGQDGPSRITDLSKASYQEGIINGKGRTNGLLNGRGTINGLLTGRSTGKVNGLINGIIVLKSGLTNGLTNGIGKTNGLGSPRFQNEARKNRWKMFVLPFVAVLVLLAPFSIISEPSGITSKINIDGDFGDWNGLSTTVSQAPDLNPNIDITKVAVENDSSYLSFYIETRGQILMGGNNIVDTIHVFIDTDGNESTGYRIKSLGADFRVTVYGKDGKPTGSLLYRFNDLRSHDDWNGWYQLGGVRSSANSNKLEFQLDWESIDEHPMKVDALFYAQSHSKEEDFADYLISNEKGSLYIKQESTASLIIEDTDNTLLNLYLEAYVDDVEIEELSIDLLGTSSGQEVSSLTLRDQDGNTLMSETPTSKQVVFDFEEPYQIQLGESRELSVIADVEGSSGNTLGASITNPRTVKLIQGVVSVTALPSDSIVGYIGNIPSGPIIDGGFSDWNNSMTDTDMTQESFPNVNILNFDKASNGSNAYFYLRVEDELMNGANVPNWNQITGDSIQGASDSDKDTMADQVDPYPYDFNNNNKADIDTNFDVDEDGISDYPTGTDYWINTTIQNTFEFPQEFRGKNVNIYIGPVIKPPVTGEDTLRAYLDVDSVSGVGYMVGSIYADYMIQITGKNCLVADKTLYMFPIGASPGDANAWQEIGAPSIAYDLRSIEIGANVLEPVNSSTAEVYFETSNAARGASDEVPKNIPEYTKGHSVPSHPEQQIAANARKFIADSRQEGTKGVSTLIDAYSDYYTTSFNNQRMIVRAGDVSGDSACDSTNSDGCWYVVFSEQYVDGSYERVIIMRSNDVEGSSWGSQIILASGRSADNPLLLLNQSSYPSMAIDSSGYIHLVWVSNKTEGSGSFYARYTKTTVAYPTQSELASASNWETVTILDNDYGALVPSVSTDSNNAPHVAISYHTGTSYIYKNKVGGSWCSNVVWSGGYAGASVDVSPQNDYVSMARYYEGATNDIQFLVCKDLSTSDCDAASEFTKWDGTAGNDTIASSVGSPAYERFPTLATTYDSNGDLWVAYAKDVDASTIAIYARYLDYPSSGWQSPETVDTVTDTKYMHPTIGVDPKGDVYAMYEDYDNSYAYIKIRTSGSWGSRTQVGDYGIYPILIVRMPTSAGYGFDIGAIYQDYNTAETFHYYIPEFSSVTLPITLIMFVVPFIIYRQRIQKRRKE